MDEAQYKALSPEDKKLWRQITESGKATILKKTSPSKTNANGHDRRKVNIHDITDDDNVIYEDGKEDDGSTNIECSQHDIVDRTTKTGTTPLPKVGETLNGCDATISAREELARNNDGGLSVLKALRTGNVKDYNNDHVCNLLSQRNGRDILEPALIMLSW